MESFGSASEAGLADTTPAEPSAAEDALVRQYSERVFLIALVRTRDREAARDLAQETMLAVILNLRNGRLLDPEKLPNYISGTARNLINNYLRTRRRRPEGGFPPEEIPVPDCEPEIEASERRFLARRALTELRPSDRLILLLTLVDGLNPAEIAERLKLRPEVVRKRKSRALERVREVLAKVSRK